jgi:hypothetical protein
MAMTSGEVPTATGMSNPSAIINAGTMTNPPPTPKKPVRKPTTSPAVTTFATTAGVIAPRRLPAPTGLTASPLTPDPSEHRDGGGDDQPGEGEYQLIRVDVTVQSGTGVGGDNTGEPEDDPGAPSHVPGSGVSDCGHE